MKSIKYVLFVHLCLILSASAELDYHFATSNDQLPAFANYLHSFDNGNLYTRAIVSPIRFYVGIDSTNATTTGYNTSNIQSSPVQLEFDDRACDTANTTVNVEFGQCVWNLEFELQANNHCTFKYKNEIEASTSGDRKRTKPLKYEDCEGGIAARPVFSDKDPILVKLEVSRTGSGIELILVGGQYVYTTESIDSIMFAISCATIIITFVLIAASVFSFRFSHLFIKQK